MPITYPLSMPTNKGIAEIHISATAVVGVSESPLTFVQQVQEFPGQKWSADITLPPMKRIDHDPWWAFLLALNGRAGTFLCMDPTKRSPKGIATGTPLVKGAGQVGNYLATDGWTANQTNILKAGDFFHMVVGGNYRLHMNLFDVNSDSSGNANIYIWPQLRESPADNTALVVNNPLGQFRLSTPVMEYQVGAGQNYAMSFGAMEAL